MSHMFVYTDSYYEFKSTLQCSDWVQWDIEICFLTGPLKF